MELKCLQCVFEKKDMLSANEYEEIKTYTRSHGMRLAGKIRVSQIPETRAILSAVGAADRGGDGLPVSRFVRSH